HSQRGRGPMGTPSRLRMSYHPLQVYGNCELVCDRFCGHKATLHRDAVANRKGTPLPICESEAHFA
ncbi:hypothetical protein NDU88_003208, partial [Pleurodeles waltl]